MGKRKVTFDELVDMAIGIPETAVNFTILHKVLKLMTRFCCKMDYTFEIDMDNMKKDVTVIGKRSRSIGSRSSSASDTDSGRTEIVTVNKEKVEKEERTDETRSHIKSEKVSKETITEHSSDVKKPSESGGEKHKQIESEKSSGKSFDKEKEKETVRDKDKDREKKKKEESQQRKEERKEKSSKKSRKDSDEEVRKKKKEKHRSREYDEFSRQSESRSNELSSQLKELSDRVESITQTITTHLTEDHLAEINGEIDKLKKSVETANDQCFDVSNSLNDQSSQIQDILTSINTIQLRKVENEELIDLLSGKADHSFVNEKVSIGHFEEIIQELKDALDQSSEQLESMLEATNTSFDEIKDDLLTKLLAEEFDTAKTKIYKELIKLTEQQDLILAQQDEHVAAGAKMRNLNCFVCNNDVVMLLEEEAIPKFRPLKASLQPLEPIVGSKIFADKNAPEWKNHQLKAKGYTRTSKANRFHSENRYEKVAYVRGKNGCMYKGNVGCDCVEAVNDIEKGKRGKCCDIVAANNEKNISLTNQMNSNCASKCNGRNGIGDVVIDSAKTDNVQLPGDSTNLIIEDAVQSTQIAEFEPTTEVSVVPEPTELEVKIEVKVETAEGVAEQVNTEIDLPPTENELQIKAEIVAPTDDENITPMESDEITTNVPDNNPTSNENAADVEDVAPTEATEVTGGTDDTNE